MGFPSHVWCVAIQNHPFVASAKSNHNAGANYGRIFIVCVCFSLPWVVINVLLPDCIEALRKGTRRQREAYETLTRLNVFVFLAKYSPTLAGTIPIAVDVETSDLDILCEAHDLDEFEREATRLYGRFPGFETRRTQSRGLPASVVNFRTDRFPVQLFAQPIPVVRQRAYRHMMVEARLLGLAGEEAKEAIRSLRRAGMKTEPAFALFFRLPGDPYEALDALADAGDGELLRIIESCQ